MNIEKIAAKLKPLMPDKIAQWTKARELADPELKSLIEKQIISIAYKTLGDFNDKILLSLPSENRAKGQINLGTILYDKEQWPLGISKDELLQNMGIYGRSGSGKTTLAFHIIKQLDYLGIPYLFFDHKRTLRQFLPQLKNKVNVYTPGRSLAKLNFNPFIAPPGIEDSVYINQLIDVMATAFTLGDGSKSMIQKAIYTCYQAGNRCPSVQNVITEVDRLESKDRIRGWKISALRALETIAFSNIGCGDRISQEQMAQMLTQENTVIELDGLPDGVHQFIVPLLYQWLYQIRLSSPEREKLAQVVFLDEAHTIMSNQPQRSSESLMEKLLRLTRELGIASVILDQTPSLISKVVLANCYTNVFLNLANASDLQKAASICLLDSEDKNYFSMLPVGQGIVKLQSRWPKAILVKFPPININKGAVTDEVLKRYFAEISSKSTHSPRKTFAEPIFNVFRPILPGVICPEALQLLHHILAYPQEGVRERYQQLGFGDKKGNRLKEQLIDSGWIESQTIEFGQTRKVLLRLTKKAKETFGLNNEVPEYGSWIHEFWKKYYAQQFQEQEYQVTLEAPRISGRTDVVARKDNQKIAIEIETGKSDFSRNIRQDLAAKYDKIIVVATDKTAFEKIEISLAREGLIIPNKIQIELAGKFKIHL
jgi:hypothetical protein